MVRAVVLGAGLVGLHFIVGLERIRRGEMEPVGVPLAGVDLGVGVGDIEVVAVYDVDDSKVGRSVYELAVELIGSEVPVPASLRGLVVRRGIHQGSLDGLVEGARGLEDEVGLRRAVDIVAEELASYRPDVVINVITTEEARAFRDPRALEEAISSRPSSVSASHAYAYSAYIAMKEYGARIALVNVIPAPLANDDAVVRLYDSAGGLVLGDDGATGATPLTADILEHLAERNRRVISIAQFNIGGNTDFQALTIPAKNRMKEITKSSVVKDILGYDAPHYIKPTGYLKPLGDKKFVSMHIWWRTFNMMEDEMVINLRINDSPALAGMLVDLARISKRLLEKGFSGTVYEVNSFFMKKPGPEGSRNKARILAYHEMLDFLREAGIVS